MAGNQLIAPPKDTAAFKYEQIAYVDSPDDKISRTYAYVAYKETNIKSGEWTVRITGNNTAGTVLNPRYMDAESAKAQGAGKEYFVYGFNLKPGPDDSRLVETRVFQKAGKPGHVEIHLITRNADGTPKEEKVAAFPWPA